MSHEAIALAIGITKPTLYKYFSLELDTGAAQKKLDVLDALFVQAKKGNVSAIKTVLLLGDPVVPKTPPAPGEEAGAPTSPTPQGPRTQRLGKKEAADLAAVGAAEGTSWDGILPGGSPRIQ
jgi:hypothetical protein